MNLKLFCCLAIAATIAVGPIAYAAGLKGLEYKRERTVKLKSGKEMRVMMGVKNGKTMAIIPMEDLNDLLRAEGVRLTIY